jgi:hypothetical protein
MFSKGWKTESGHESVNMASDSDEDITPLSSISVSYISANEYVMEAEAVPFGELAVTRMTFSPTGSISQSLPTLIAVNKLSPGFKNQIVNKMYTISQLSDFYQ